MGIPVLLFHKIGHYQVSASMPWFYISQSHFYSLLDIFARKDYQSLSLSDALNVDAQVGNRFVISFDDGYESTLRYAAPRLKEHGCAAIQFLVASRLGQRNDWDLGLDTTMERLMSETQVREWLSLGFEIGAHTLTHPRLSAISIGEARNEIAGSKKRLEDLFGVRLKHFAYPYGDYNDVIVDLVREAGFETACTCDPGVVRHGVDALRLGRFLTDERSFTAFSSYKLSYALDDLKDLTRPGRRAVWQLVTRAYRHAFPRDNGWT
jgi:peptidoglycan/xylan/chitin deacetylase (PgdA/CDA1 family)